MSEPDYDTAGGDYQNAAIIELIDEIKSLDIFDMIESRTDYQGDGCWDVIVELQRQGSELFQFFFEAAVRDDGSLRLIYGDDNELDIEDLPWHLLSTALEKWQ